MAARRKLEREMDNGMVANGRKILINVGRRDRKNCIILKSIRVDSIRLSFSRKRQ